MSKIRLPFFLKWLRILGVLGALAYTATCGALVLWQNRLVFHPSRVIETTPSAFHLSYQDVWLPVVSRTGHIEHMHGWWVPAAEPKAGMILCLHGKAGSMAGLITFANRFHYLGLSVLMIEYRGYGDSEGSFPTEFSVYQDAQAAWNYLIQKLQFNPKQIFLYGHSLGGAIAIDLAVRHSEAAGLIVESSFTSMRQMIAYRKQFWMFPVDLLLTQRFDSIAKVRSLRIPVLFIHGTADSVVPSSMSQMLFAAAPQPKQLLLVPGADHGNAGELRPAQYFQMVQKFIRTTKD